MACKEAIWLTRLLLKSDVSTDLSREMTVFTDNHSGIKLSANESNNNRNKHIDITYHFVRRVVDEGKVVLSYIRTEEIVADMLTKALGRVKFEKLRHLFGMRLKGKY